MNYFSKELSTAKRSAPRRCRCGAEPTLVRQAAELPSWYSNANAANELGSGNLMLRYRPRCGARKRPGAIASEDARIRASDNPTGKFA
jgi:hypothetical protein